MEVCIELLKDQKVVKFEEAEVKIVGPEPFAVSFHGYIFWLDSKSIYGKVCISQNSHWAIGFLICSGFAILKVLPYLLTQPEYIYLYGGKAFFLAQDTVGLWSQGIPQKV